MKNLLLVEDSSECYDLIDNIFNEDFKISWVTCKKEARDIIDVKPFDVIILDLILPDGEGIDLLQKINKSEKNHNTPTLILTSKTDLPDRIFGFSMGADDYVCKPFEPIELKFRVMARIKNHQKGTMELHFDDIELKLLSNEVYLGSENDKHRIELTNNEFKVLQCLVQAAGTTLSREEILNIVWGEDVYLYPRIVDTYISRLRKKLSESCVKIQSKNRRGYYIQSPNIANN